jgi:hypothetical protein
MLAAGGEAGSPEDLAAAGTATADSGTLLRTAGAGFSFLASMTGRGRGRDVRFPAAESTERSTRERSSQGPRAPGNFSKIY